MKTNLFTSRTFAVGAILLLSLVAYSCARESVSNGKQPAVEASSPSNPDNPYDFVGAFHNEAIALAMEKNSTRSQTTPREAVIDGLEAANVVLSKNGLSSRLVKCSDKDIDDLVNVFTYMVSDADNGFHNFLNSADVSLTTKLTVQMLFDDILSLEGYPLDVILNRVKCFEADIISNKSAYTPQEYESILNTTSTLRYSCTYWSNEYQGSTRRPWFKWLRVGLSDALGALLGSAVGNPWLIGGLASVYSAITVFGGIVIADDVPIKVTIPDGLILKTEEE